jgi:hypothetical protein
MEKTPIDKHRDGAISSTVGTAEEGAIQEMISLDSALFIVKERAIYATVLADQIDPARTNISIPQSVHQKWASIGTQSELVSRTLLTATELFKESYLQPSTRCKDCIAGTMEILKELIALRDATDRFQILHDKEKESLPKGQQSFHLPSIPDAKTHIELFVSRAEHAVQKIYALCQLFYGSELAKNGKFIDGLLVTIRDRYGADDSFTKFTEAASHFLKFIRNTRHCVEHPKPTQRIDVKDFSLHASGTIHLPTIEVIHPETPQEPIPIIDFMKQASESLLDVTENMIALLCSKHVRSAGMPTEICHVPDQDRRYKMVRFGYVIFIGGQWMRAG